MKILAGGAAPRTPRTLGLRPRRRAEKEEEEEEEEEEEGGGAPPPRTPPIVSAFGLAGQLPNRDFGHSGNRLLKFGASGALKNILENQGS